MYVLENTYTGRFLYPALMGKVKKMYRSKVEAEAAVERLAPLINPKRVDVVELSKSALLWLEAQQKSSPTPH
jgi:hypothetical protein